MEFDTTRREFLTAMGIGAAALALPARFAAAQTGASVVLNPYSAVQWPSIQQHKAALHIHTLQSDGWHLPVDVIKAYRRVGYTVMAITDHDWNTPNFQVEKENVPAQNASPYPDPKPANYPANPTWPWTEFGAPAPEELGMVGIQGNELTYRHHINSFFNDHGEWHGRPGQDIGSKAPYTNIEDEDGNPLWEDDFIAAVRKKGGLTFLNHPGIDEAQNWWTRQPLEWYVERFKVNPADCLIGMEITNNAPKYEGYDESLWDQLLARFMPNRSIWGFGTDDMHNLAKPRQSFTVFLLDGLSSDSVRKAMEAGQFVSCKSTRNIDYSDESAELDVFPMPESVRVDESAGTITVETSDCDEIRWISAPASLEPTEDFRTSDHPWPAGTVVHRGHTLDFRDTAGVKGFVRAELHRRDGEHTHRTFMNPFGISAD